MDLVGCITIHLIGLVKSQCLMPTLITLIYSEFAALVFVNNVGYFAGRCFAEFSQQMLAKFGKFCTQITVYRKMSPVRFKGSHSGHLPPIIIIVSPNYFHFFILLFVF